ncbi:MAG: MBL fold metallo-hydrolase [Candidatus Pacearchaeota archaeon]
MKIGESELEWLGHAGVFLKNSVNIYIDPYKISDKSEKADLLLITHGHYDHFSLEDIKKVVKEGTKVVCPAECQSKIARLEVTLDIRVIEEGQSLDLEGLKIIALPAYNTENNFHPREAGGLGYLIKTEDFLVYHAGDTDSIPEMQKLTGHKQEGKDFVALLPVGGRFTMSAEDAAEAANTIKPTLAIPIHWGSIVGSEEDAQEFKELCEEKKIKVEIPGKT